MSLPFNAILVGIQQTDSPLQPDKMSIPTTCNTIIIPNGQHDVAFHVLFGTNTNLILSMLTAMIHRMHKISQSNHLAATLQRLVSDKSIGIDIMKGLWILLLNVDMRTKDLLMQPRNRGLQRLALSYDGVSKDAMENACASLNVMKPMDNGTAARFLVDLHLELVPKWLQNEILTCQDLVRSTTSLYINS